MKNVDTSQLDAYIQRLENAQNKMDDFYDYALRQLAADFLGKVIMTTPVFENNAKTKKRKSTKTRRGGRLVRGWCKLEGPGPRPTTPQQRAYLATLSTAGNRIELVNPVYYGVYVNNGHVTPDRRGWIDGKFFVEHAVDQVHPERLLERALKRWLRKL